MYGWHKPTKHPSKRAANWHPPVDIPRTKFYFTDGKNKLICTILYGTFKTKSASHTAAFRTPWCKIGGIFPTVQTGKLKKNGAESTSTLSHWQRQRQNLRFLDASLPLLWLLGTSPTLKPHTTSFWSTTCTVSPFGETDMWGHDCIKEQGTLRNFTAAERWRVLYLCKNLTLSTPQSQEKCQRPLVSLGGLAFRRDNSCECLQDKDIIHRDSSNGRY